jgi:hypothetical protein
MGIKDETLKKARGHGAGDGPLGPRLPDAVSSIISTTLIVPENADNPLKHWGKSGLIVLAGRSIDNCIAASVLQV